MIAQVATEVSRLLLLRWDARHGRSIDRRNPHRVQKCSRRIIAPDFRRREFDRLAEVVGRPVEEADLAPFNWSMLQYGRSLSATQYSASFAAVRKASQRIAIELSPYDVFVTPTLTQPPRPPGYWSMEDGNRERYLARWSDAAFMFTFNMSGLPAMSVPAAMSRENAPIGLQLVGRYGDEAAILGLARQMEGAAPWSQRRPAICAA